MRFNIFNRNKTVVRNHEGAKAFALTPEMELYSAVVTAGLSDQFYEKANDKLSRIQELIQKNDPEFVARLAVYARSEMHMRSVPLVLAVEMARQYSGNAVVSKTVSKVVQRADEITELLAYYQLANQRKGTKKLNKLSKQIQKGLSVSFNRFDEYQFAKYERATEVKLRDALFLVHPKAKDEAQQALFNKIVAQELATPYTWETELSALGQKVFEKQSQRSVAVKSKWEELIDSKKVGYMAMLRNLRNIMEAEVSVEHMEKVCSYLSDAKAVANSKQLPFRFLAAYREIKVMNSEYVNMVLTALEDAIAASATNIEGFNSATSVLIACDVSGSMQKAISAKSKVMLYDIGLVLAMLMQSRCKTVVSGMFGDRWKIVNMPVKNILANVDEFYRREGEVGYATNGHLVIKDLIERNKVVDKVLMFTDTQMYNNTRIFGQTISDYWKQYKKIAPQAKLYLFDLAGYGNSPVKTEQHDVYLIAGWSDKIFGMLSALEGGTSVIEKIKQTEL